MRALVTGGAGFIGSHLVDRLLDENHQVVVLDNFSTGRRENLAQRATDGRLRVIDGSVTDHASVAQAIDGCGLVFHLAAAIGVRYVIDDPLGGIATNVRGTEIVLAAARAVGARVVLASSSEVYGKGAAGDEWRPFAEEDDSRIGPTSVARWWYALAKGLDEHLGLAYQRTHGLPISAVRYFNIYGPRCNPGGYGVLARFISQALLGEPLTVFGDGLQTRSFTYVDDAVEATLRAGTRAEAVGQILNVGSDREVSILDTAQLVLRLTGSRAPIHHQEHAAVFGAAFEDTRRRVPNVDKIGRLLGFSATVNLEEGIGRTARWWSAQIGPLSP